MSLDFHPVTIIHIVTKTKNLLHFLLDEKAIKPVSFKNFCGFSSSTWTLTITHAEKHAK